jgi:hypothetical protein
LHRLERRSAHHEVRGERVPQCVPSDPSHRCPLARAPQGPLAGALAEHLARVVAKDELCAKMPLTLERSERLLVERDLRRLPLLRLSQ